MRTVFRNGFFSAAAISLSSIRSLTLNPNPPFLSHHFPPILNSIIPHYQYAAVAPLRFSTFRHCYSCFANFSPMTTGGGGEGEGEMGAPPSPTSGILEKQFEDFRHNLEDSGNLRDRIRAVAMEIESTTRLMHSSLLLVHQTCPIPGTFVCSFHKVKAFNLNFG